MVNDDLQADLEATHHVDEDLTTGQIVRAAIMEDRRALRHLTRIRIALGVDLGAARHTEADHARVAHVAASAHKCLITHP